MPSCCVTRRVRLRWSSWLTCALPFACQMQQFVNGFNNMWAVPLRIVGAMYLLYLQVGLGLLGALAVLLISIPLTTTLMRRAKNYQRMILRSTDRRTKIITEILSGIAVVKLYAWDEPMRARVAQARALELKFVNGFLVCLALGIQLVVRCRSSLHRGERC